MKKIETQIEGQLNIFDFTNEKRPPEFEHRPPPEKINPCPGCIWMSDCCLWDGSESECKYKFNFMSAAEGWNRLIINPNNGRVSGDVPTNTECRLPVEVVLFTEECRMHIAAGEGRNGAIIMPKGTPKGQIVAWRYFERGKKSDEKSN